MPPAAAPRRHPSRNLELKVRGDPARLADARARLAAAGVPARPALRQVDTYFDVPHGRLKLREIVPADADADADADAAVLPTAELIAYARPDDPAARWSAYHLAPVPAAAAPAVRATLAAALGVRTVLVKRRQVAIVGRTRVHLDLVDGLGAFIELETVLGDDGSAGTDADAVGTTAAAELAAVAALVGLDPAGDGVVAGSYADLLLDAAAALGRDGNGAPTNPAAGTDAPLVWEEHQIGPARAEEDA